MVTNLTFSILINTYINGLQSLRFFYKDITQPLMTLQEAN